MQCKKCNIIMSISGTSYHKKENRNDKGYKRYDECPSCHYRRYNNGLNFQEVMLLGRCIKMERIIISENMEPIIDSYYKNNAKKLYNMVDKILFKLHFVDIDKNDFYSLANEVFMYTIRDYDPSRSFDKFLYSCLYKKFCSEMTRRHREKRKADRMSISIDTPIGTDESLTLADTITGNFDVEKEVFEDSEEEYSSKMLLYLSKLSNLQKEVLKLNIAGYLPNEIREELHITEKEYMDCYAAIHSYRNVSVLF